MTLLRDDPFTQGPKLFSQKCASCHRYGGNDGNGVIPRDPQTASDLKGFGSREWLTGLLDPARIVTTNYFGGTKHREGKMVKFVTKDIAASSPEQKEKLRKVIAAVSAEAQLPAQLAVPQPHTSLPVMLLVLVAVAVASMLRPSDKEPLWAIVINCN